MIDYKKLMEKYKDVKIKEVRTTTQNNEGSWSSKVTYRRDDK